MGISLVGASLVGAGLGGTGLGGVALFGCLAPVGSGVAAGCAVDCIGRGSIGRLAVAIVLAATAMSAAAS